MNTIRSAMLLPGLLAAQTVPPAAFGVADPDGIWSLQTNPAGLGVHENTEFGAQLGGGQPYGQDALRLGGSGFAAGWDRSHVNELDLERSQWRLGLGARLAPGFYAGIAGVRQTLDGNVTGWSADLGLLWQPIDRLSFGWVLPNLQGRDGFRSTGNNLGVAIRPLGGLDLQAGLEARLSGAAWIRDAWNDPSYEATLQLRPLPWLSVSGRVDPLDLERWGMALAVQSTPDFRLFSSSVPSRNGPEFQTLGVHWTKSSRPAAGTTSPVFLYHLAGDLGEAPKDGFFSHSGGLAKVREDFQEIRTTAGIKTVILDLGYGRLSPTTAGIVRREILDLRRSGRKVYAWAHDMDMANMYVLSAADKAGLSPDGAIMARGLAMNLLYYGKALKKHGVEVQVVKTGPWKSAMEPFTSEHMSKPARENMSRFLFDLDSCILAAVVKDRKVDPAKLVAYVDSGSLLARSGVAVGLLDTLIDRADLSKWAETPRQGMAHLNLQGKRQEVWGRIPHVVVVPIEGQIIDHKGQPGMVPWASGLPGDQVATLLDRLRENPNVAAVVLRVNSPGGSVAGSERMRRAVEKLAAKKPVAASFGATTASGAYLLSLPASRIFTEPEGIVGSIGAFAAKASFEGLLDSLGVHVERVRTAPHAGSTSMLVPLDSLELARLSEFVEDAHREFGDLVRKWRKLDSTKFEKVDGGRIFSGARAVELGLADTLGGLEQAVRWTAAKAGVDPESSAEWVAPANRDFLDPLAEAIAQAQGAQNPSEVLHRIFPLSRTSVWAQTPWDPDWE